MRKSLLTMLAFAMTMVSALAQTGNETALFERTYISTDKDIYVAGDRVWCSAFCFDLSDSKLSKKSAIAYIELVSSTGEIIQTAKIALEGGRGGGYLEIPSSLPTGNYRMFAFTAVNKNEEGYDFLGNSKVLSVFNAKSAAKVKDRVEIVSDEIYGQRKASVHGDPEQGDIYIDIPRFVKKGQTFDFSIANNGSQPSSLSVSIYHEDALAAAEDKAITSFRMPSSADGLGYEPRYLVENEGEIIYADLGGKDRDMILQDEPRASGYISSPDSDGDTYTSVIRPDGTIVFPTSNIFGNREIVTEVADLENPELIGLVDIRSPFVSVESDVPMLPLADCISKSVVERGRQMQLFRMEYADSTAEFRARREAFPYNVADAVVYRLDDYTRFPTVREVLVEITPEVRVRGRNEKQKIQVLTKDIDGDGGISMNWANSLVLLDGVPVFRHSDMMEYDAMLLKEIHIWRERYLFGSKTFFGVVNFISKRGNMAFMDFGSNVRIIDFQGTAYPMDHTKKFAKDGQEDLRGTIWWKPEVEVGAGQKTTAQCQAPDYFGRFCIVVEGVDSNGDFIHKKATFVVED